MLKWDSSTAAGLLRAGRDAIMSAWERDVYGDVPELLRLTPHSLREPLDGLVDGVADYLDGRPDRAATLWTIAEAHALHRLIHGFALADLLGEYARFRLCMHAALAELAPLSILDQVIDLIAAHAAEHYHDEREQRRDRFVAMLAHDLRTPIACVAMACELLVAGEHAPHHRPFVDQIVDAADRMERMVTDVLMFARAELGDDIPIAPHDLDLGDLVRVVVEETRTIYGDHTVAFEISGNLRGAFDRDRVRQLVTNLLRNAIEHGRGSVFVRAWEGTDGREMLLVVQNGTAVRAPTLTSTPVSGRRTRSTNMRGLGLYIVDQIARAHGAHVELSSSDNEATVTVRWPRPVRSEQPALSHEGASSMQCER